MDLFCRKCGKRAGLNASPHELAELWKARDTWARASSRLAGSFLHWCAHHQDHPVCQIDKIGRTCELPSDDWEEPPTR